MNDAVLNIIIKATDQASKTAANVSSALDSVSKTVDSVGTASIDAGKNLSAKLTLPVLGLGAASFKTAADFDKTMRQVGAATNAPASGIKELTDLAIKMGQETTFSASDASQAMLALAKGGITEAQIKAGALSATMTLAAAGQISMGNAAGYVSNALNTFGLGADQAAAVAAAFAGGANASTASVESLGQALSQVGPGAKLAGLSIQETVGALAAFDNAGIKGSDAGTSLKTMLLGLVPSTKEAKDMISQLGLNFVDAQGKIRPLAAIAEELKTKMSGLNATQKQQALQTIFGADAFRAAAVLMQEGAQGVEKYTAATNDLGAAEKMAKVGTEGMSGSVESMMGSIDTAAIKMGTALAPIVAKLADKVGMLADKFTALNPEQQKTILIVAGVAAAIGPVLIAFGAMAKGVSAVIKVASVASKVLGVTAQAAGYAAKALPIVAKAFMFLGRAASTALLSIGRAGLALLANPVFLAITAVVLVLAGLAFLIIKNWDTLKAFMVGLWQGIYNAAVTAIQAIWSVIEPVVNLIINIFKAYLAVYTYIFSVIKGLAIVVFEFLWNSVVKPVIDSMVNAFNFWKDVVVGVFNAIKDVAIVVWNGIYSGMSWAWGQVVAVWNQATGFFGGIWDKLSGGVKTIADSISSAFSGAFENAKSIVKAAVNWMIDRINNIITGVNNTAGKLPGVPKISQVPRLEAGGIVTKPTVAMVGEGREPEAVIPLSKLNNMLGRGPASSSGGGGNTTIVNVYPQTAEAVREVFRQLDNDTILTGRGLTPARGGAA